MCMIYALKTENENLVGNDIDYKNDVHQIRQETS